MHLTKKIKINPTEEQVDVLWQLSEQCRCLYNFVLAERKKRFLSQNALWTGYQKFSDNLRQTGLQMDTCIMQISR
ncbi:MULTISPECIES: helix-turn-helix domain-containing protein [unclassified Methanosarcina]|uniref:helix-turn-helix domain-containing protein n=1 Tax=unclassified Methanosarcina TaxID=2644672 RepID=UPI0009E454C6|nr:MULTISPECIES: helix-turn-helix domain-containing protein [unclassified Methanosarcina]